MEVLHKYVRKFDAFASSFTACRGKDDGQRWGLWGNSGAKSEHHMREVRELLLAATLGVLLSELCRKLFRRVSHYAALSLMPAAVEVSSGEPKAVAGRMPPSLSVEQSSCRSTSGPAASQEGREPTAIADLAVEMPFELVTCWTVLLLQFATQIDPSEPGASPRGCWPTVIDD